MFISEITTLLLNGITNQALKLNINSIKGPPKKRIVEAFCGIGFSFITSFRASAKGCKIPKNPVQLGPFLFWILAKTLRSNKVKKATARIIFRTK